MKAGLRYAFILTAIYLGVAHATAGGTLIKAGASGVRTVEKTFQGR